VGIATAYSTQTVALVLNSHLHENHGMLKKR
jgi:hypothetical protein